MKIDIPADTLYHIDEHGNKIYYLYMCRRDKRIQPATENDVRIALFNARKDDDKTNTDIKERNIRLKHRVVLCHACRKKMILQSFIEPLESAEPIPVGETLAEEIIREEKAPNS